MKNRTQKCPAYAETQHMALVLTMLESIDCARALSIAILLRYGQVTQALSLRFSPLDYEAPLDFARSWQAHRLLAKCDFFDLGIDRKAAALSTFWAAERQCRATNRRLRTSPQMGRSWRILLHARKKIYQLLGELTPEKIEKILGLARWGGGSTSSCKGRYTQRVNKIASSADHTPSLSFVRQVSTPPDWFPVGLFSEVPGNRIDTVPKSWKTDRTIAVEPTLNSALQRGVGRFLSGALRRWGLTTTDQSPNQRLAREGSITGDYVTLDLSSASDTVSQGLLEVLLPSGWLAFLNHLRSPLFHLDGEWHRYEKHSSMGNGYTFELETLVFGSLVLACRDITNSTGDYSVYGDDIVCERHYAGLLRGALRMAGFSVNHDKSFFNGRFRESCGEEYFRGTRVTPHYLRGLSEKFVISRMTLMNWLRSDHSWFMEKTARLWRTALSQIPVAFRLPGPVCLDSVIHVNPWETIQGTNLTESVSPPLPRGPFRLYKVQAYQFTPSRRLLSSLGEAGLADWYLRCDDRRALDVPEHFGYTFLLPTDMYNMARRLGKWGCLPISFAEWGVVGLLR